MRTFVNPNAVSAKGWGAGIFAVSLTSLFVLQVFVYGGVGRLDSDPEGLQRFFFLTWLGALAGAILMGRDNISLSWQRMRVRWWKYAYFLVLLLVVGQAVFGLVSERSLDYANVSKLLMQATLYLAPLILVPMGAALLHNRVFQYMVAFHAIAGGVVGLWIILTRGLANRIDYYAVDTGINFTGGLPFYSVPLAMLLLPYLPRLLGLGVVAGSFGWLAYGITFQSRITSVVYIVVLLLLFVTIIRHSQTSRLSRLLMWSSGVGLFVMIAITAFLLVRNEQVGEGLIALVTRWTEKESVLKTTVENVRYDEAFLVTEQLTLKDWLMGRGIMGTWSDYRIYEGELRNMVHFGYLHYVFIGGMGLFLLLCVAPAIAVVQAWRGAFGLEFVAIGMGIIRTIELFAYGVPHYTPLWLVTCICIGAVLRSGRPVVRPPVAALAAHQPTRDHQSSSSNKLLALQGKHGYSSP